MFDHVQIAVSDLSVSETFYRKVLATLGAEPVRGDDQLVEWEDWDVLLSDAEHPVSSGLQVGFRAADRAAVEAFGGPLRDPDGTVVEAIDAPRERSLPGGRIERLELRVSDLAESRRFYETIAPHAGLTVAAGGSDEVVVGEPGQDLALVADGRPPTRNVHIAFTVDDDARVREFHAAALAAGFTDNGAPGERPEYHPGYYGAFVLDPDGNNVELVNHNRD